MVLDPNEIFYSNYLDASARLYEIEEFHKYMDGFLLQEKRFFEEEAHPDLEIEFLPLFGETFPPILHSSLIITLVIFLEIEIKGFSNTLQMALGQKLTLSDLSGSLFERFKKYVTKVAQLEIDLRENIWQDISGIIEIRNCLVHTSGSLEDFSGAKSIRTFSLRHGRPGIKDNQIIMDQEISIEAMKIITSFIDTIYDAAITKFPGKHKSISSLSC